MGQGSGIEWTDHTWNSWEGCTKVSPGCANCYAEARAERFGSVVWGPQGTRRVKAESGWKELRKWDRLAREAGVRHRVFCHSLSDIFEAWDGPMVDALRVAVKVNEMTGQWSTQKGYSPTSLGTHRYLTMADVRARLFEEIEATTNLDYLFVTKRPENVLGMWPRVGFPDAGVPGTLGRYLHFPNVWLGVSVENQKAADERIPILLSLPAAVRFLSVEPMLGPIDFSRWIGDRQSDVIARRLAGLSYERNFIHWAIFGGESGDDARPCNVEWIREGVRQCRVAGVAAFVKQLGACPVMNRLVHGDAWGSAELETSYLQLCNDHGGDWDEWPDELADLKVREFPAARKTVAV